jgi:signal transduction histidine kinase
MVRRISTKLLLAVLAAVIIPFLGFALYADQAVAERSKQVVLFALRGLASDLAARIDRHVARCVGDVELQSRLRTCDWAIEEHREWRAGGSSEDTMRSLLRDQFDDAVRAREDVDLVLLVERGGRAVAASSIDSSGRPVPEGVIFELYARDFGAEPWFTEGLAGRAANVDQHVSELLPPRNPSPGTHPENFHVGFSAPVLSKADPAEVSGVLYALVNWRTIQDELRQPVLKDYFQGLVGQGEFPSAYGWVWSSDADTIIAHNDVSLYGELVSGPRIGLPQMVEDARSADSGLYREYTFRGERKNAAFRRTARPEQGGFGWVVGVGIDNDDIFQGVRELRGLLLEATLLVLLCSTLLTMIVARRTTQPIRALERHTRRVAAGDLDARIAVTTDDELGQLARAFNDMTAEVKQQREQLVKAEKDAAWREMARQVAHDIKNPLTPIQLWIDLLARAKQERSPELDSIFARTVDTVRRQVEHLRGIASDFHALTGVGEAHPTSFDAGELLAEVFELNAALCAERGIAQRLSGPGGRVRQDQGLLRRVLMNLVSNAIEAMPEGGELHGSARAEGGRLVLEVRDTGVGIPAEARARLFEPYFTTRSTGTGLGLAISKRVVEEMGGEIALFPNDPAPGTTARVALPLET